MYVLPQLNINKIRLMTPNLLITRKSTFHALVTCSIYVPSSDVLDYTGAPWTLAGSVGTLVR